MTSPVWLISDLATQEVSYIFHGLEDDEPNWRWIGPFAFTSEEAARVAIQEKKFLPLGISGEFTLLEVDAASFIRAIYNGFPPKHTDVFVLDQVLLPLTLNGATWIDDANGTPVWAALFDEDGEGVGLDWLDRVLDQVAARLGMSMETVQAIGTLNAAEEDAAEVEQTRSLIQQHVRVTLTPEPGTIQMGPTVNKERRLTPAALFWLHTNGLSKFGLPELEIRQVPVWWVAAAGGELLNWAAYSLDHGIADNEILQSNSPVVLSLRASNSKDPMWLKHTTGCLRLTVDDVTFVTESEDEPSFTSGAHPKMVH